MSCHQNFVLHNLILSRSLGQNYDTPTYMEVLSGREYFPCEDFRKATETSTPVHELCCTKLNIENVES